LSLFSKTRPTARSFAVACLVGLASVSGVASAYLTGSASPEPGAQPVVVPIAAATRVSLVNAASQHALARQGSLQASPLSALASRLNPALLHAAVLQSPAPFRLANPADTASDLNCLTAAVYYEARGESREGQAAVAQVVLNRVRNPAFPKTVCGVVYQGTGGRSCQFSFACDGQTGARHEAGAWDRARDVAGRALGGYVMSTVGGATHFHVASLGAIWNGSMFKVAQVGQHVFYGFGGRRGAIASDMARNSKASDIAVPTVKALDKSAPTPTTVAITIPPAAPVQLSTAS